MISVWRVTGERFHSHTGVQLRARFDRCFAVRYITTEAGIRRWLMNDAARCYMIDVNYIESVSYVCDTEVWDVR
jgi:hypothetical protein